jgi:hypothetical protein
MISDEGLIFLPNTEDTSVFYGQFKYTRDENSKVLPEMFTRPDGSTPGYVSHCNEIAHGWFLQGEGGRRKVFCFSARKVIPDPGLRGAAISPHEFGTTLDDSFESREFAPEFAVEPIIPPKSYDVQPKGKDACGSCYVKTFAYAFERTLAHFFLKSSQRSGQHVPSFRLDTDAMLVSSYSSMGCNGGYYESLTLDMTLTGIPLCGSDNDGMHCGSSRGLVYPKGFIQLQTEAEVKTLLVTNGPVLVGIFMDRDAFNPLSSDIVYDIPKSTESQNPEWDYINHGIVITGWGTTIGGVDFWTTYNSWGFEAKIQRGPDHDWYLKYAVAVLPDLSRGALPEIFQPQ